MHIPLYYPVTDDDHKEGLSSAPLELLQYGDYQCPTCGLAFYAIKKVQLALGDNLKFVFRNFPLTEIHPNAQNAALSAEAAGLQHQFWPMHDLLFRNQKKLEEIHLMTYAEKLGLNLTVFEKDLISPVLAKRIEHDFEGGIRSGVHGTPTFYLNGLKFTGDWQGEGFIFYLKEQLRSGQL